MPQNIVESFKKPFIFAGQKVESVTFQVGERFTKIDGLYGAPVRDGSVIIQCSPRFMREVAQDMIAQADAAERILKAG